MALAEQQHEANANAAEEPYPSEGYAWYVVAILMIIYIFSFIDRQVLAYLVGPIKEDLGVSDTAMGLLGGTTFAIFYTFFGIPLGRLADTRSRRGIIAIGLFLWSLMTSACGVARSFAHLLIFRVGVGVGEAALSPSAYSLIADYFKPGRMALAISVYGAGIYIGSGVASIVSGYLVEFATAREAFNFPIVGETNPWQLVFFAIGIPGLFFTLAILSVREPKRRGVVLKKGQADIPFAEVLTYVQANWKTFFCHCVGFGFFALIGYAGAYWVPAVFVRTHGWSLADVGLRYGLAVIFFGSGGIIFGGQLADWMSRKGYTAAKMRVGLLAVLIHLPAGILFPIVSNDWLAFVILCPAVFAIGMPFGVAPAAIQEMMPNQMRGQAAALYLFFVNLIGMGIGPFAVGWISDYVLKDESRLNEALAMTNVSANIVAIVLLYFGIGFFRRSLDHRDDWHKAQSA